MKIGYDRVPTEDQNPDLQLTTLKQAGCSKIFTDKATELLRGGVPVTVVQDLPGDASLTTTAVSLRLSGQEPKSILK